MERKVQFLFLLLFCYSSVFLLFFLPRIPSTWKVPDPKKKEVEVVSVAAEMGLLQRNRNIRNLAVIAHTRQFDLGCLQDLLLNTTVTPSLIFTLKEYATEFTKQLFWRR